MSRLIRLITFLMQTIVKKKIRYVFIGFLSVIVLRIATHNMVLSDFTTENRFLDVLSFEHFFGVWLSVFVFSTAFGEVCYGNTDYLLSLGISRRKLISACIFAVLIVIFCWGLVVTMVATSMLGLSTLWFTRMLLASCIINLSYFFVVSLSLLYFCRFSHNVSAFLALITYMATLTITPRLPNIAALGWLIPNLDKLYMQSSFILIKGTNCINESIAAPLASVSVWLVIGCVALINVYQSRDLVS